MTSSDRLPGESAPAPPSLLQTLRPPEWMASAPESSRTSLEPALPLARYRGARAEEASMRARVDEARVSGDADALRTACTNLARWLGSRDRDLDEAVDLASTALGLGEDPELRRQLAAWLESLGEPARAASLIEATEASRWSDPSESAYALQRAGTLYARAGEENKAAEAFRRAAHADGGDPVPAELLGTLAATRPDVVAPPAGAEALVQAARRRSALGQAEAEVEDLWRAFALDVCSETAVHALADALERMGRVAAADEVWRAHAAALGPVDPARMAQVHAYRRAWALLAQDRARALGTGLDERLDATLDGEAARALDALLLEAGLLEGVAARLEARAEQAPAGPERAAILVELGRLCMGPLASDTRAVAAFAAALAEDPSSEEARAGLRATPPAGSRPPHLPAEPGPGSASAVARAWVRAALGGEAGPLARATERMAEGTAPPLRAVLLAVAAQRYAEAGKPGAARAAAELATQSDPSSVRAIATLADLASTDRDRRAAAALEHAIARIGPRPGWCRALAAALDELGEAAGAATWAQRALSVSPGDRDLIRESLERLARASDPARLAESIASLLAQPQPADWLDAPLARSLADLSLADPDRALVLARRALDVLGPRLPLLRRALLDTALRGSDRAFAIALLERWLAAGAEEPERAEAFARLAELRESVGDPEGEARALARAVRERLAPADTPARLERLAAAALTPDGVLWHKRARAEQIQAGSDGAAAALAWRDLGAARWDLADDRAGAVAAWRRAARAAPAGGYAALCGDLATFAGIAFAVDRLTRLIDAELDDGAAAVMAAEMGQAALAIGEARAAFDLAARGVARRPSSPDAIAVAERAAAACGDHDAVSALYDLVATRAFGRFGRRAIHHRGARFFERHGEHALALKHASQAFYAVPSEGAAFQTLERAAARAGDRAQAVRAIELVAEHAQRSEARARWLLRAASIAGEGEDGARRKVDALLGAVAAAPAAATIGLLRDACRDLLKFGPEEREVVEMRLRRAALAKSERSTGAAGAQVAIAFAILVLDLFGDAAAAHELLGRAVAADPSSEEFERLLPFVPALASFEGAGDRVAALFSSASPGAPPRGRSSAALRLLAAVAGAARAPVAGAADAEPVADAPPPTPVPTTPVPRTSPVPQGTADAQSVARAEPDSPSKRADRWMDIAAKREARGDAPGALRAILEACQLDPESLERWSELERLAESAGDAQTSVRALEEIAARVGPDGRTAALKRLARSHERRADVAAAEEAWQRVFSLDPTDEEADFAIESAIVARGRYDELAEHLAGRVARLEADPERREMLRAVRLRRAAILEQRLERLQDASAELRAVLREWPDHSGALRYLADVRERLGDRAGAAPLWARAASVEVGAEERDDLELRAGEAWHASGDMAAARESARRVLARSPSLRRALDLRMLVARASGSDAEIGDALDDAASAGGAGTDERSAMLTEAALAAARAGDGLLALDRARRGAEASPDRAAAQLLARRLEYRLRGAGTADDAARTVHELGRVARPLDRDAHALRAFLLAAALDVVGEEGAGLRELDAALAIVGQHPYLALGRAPRLLARGEIDSGLAEYRVALEGDVSELRDPGKVSIEAADAAIAAKRAADAERFLKIADRFEATRSVVANRRAALETLVPAPGPATAPGDARTLPDLEGAVKAARTAPEAAAARLALARATLAHGDLAAAEPLLWEALGAGSVEAGDALADLLARSRDRTHDIVRVRAQQASIEPGDIGRLQALRAAALADDDVVYGRAIEHLLRAFDPGARPLEPPPLATQMEHPGILALLTRPSLDPAGEALAGLWEGASQLFVRDPASYGITGVERVVPGPTSAISRLYEAAIRLLDARRIPLFVVRTRPGPSAAHAALLSPPSVVLSGDCRDDTPELRFALGMGISAALPQNVLRLALPQAESRAVIEAVGAAFGPADGGRPSDARAVRLAESFWQMVPAGIQRRLQQLVGGAAMPAHEALLHRAEQSGRRVGLFLAGDIACASRALLSSKGLLPDSGVLPLEDLRSACQEIPSLADLFRLAASAEYADARWQTVSPGTRRGNLSTGRFSLL
jgi:tetratricopeptide (TPR) repeat protein